jgi:hypothetical protein
MIFYQKSRRDLTFIEDGCRMMYDPGGFNVYGCFVKNPEGI